ncbi:MAG TPA: biotin carboxylase N-terminal domain-containing protein [Xanthobacteraceae bacterium]|nr:biotin carboxylase N-terminal domain-containing protein [Xanthobacteraceae bacterium]
MFKSVLIANRGEIACRIARTATRLGMRTIAVYSAADAHALHRRLCDESYFIGGAEPRESYLSIEKLIEAAKRADAECVHPGYGFLSESADFAEACARAGLVFVGPPPAAIRAMGLKDHAKTLMQKAGVPVVPGYHGERQEPAFLKEQADAIGYPVLIKPAAGGGGRGMRRVERGVDFADALAAAVRETASAFGSSRVLVEKYVSAPRHIEIQVFADAHGNVIHLGERDCSLQRRHQKVIEETPAPAMTGRLRAKMGAAAVEAARAVGYASAGTVEFVADGSRGLREDGFWFIEMNTRLQVEHPVTEEVTGLDLVAWQFRVAAGEPLPMSQSEIRFNGHAVEARVYAEDPENGFLPSTGKIVGLELPRGIRVDSGVEAGGEVSPFYDAMIAKLVVHAETREAALDPMTRALDETLVAGVRNNVAFLRALCASPEFRQGHFDTGYIDRNLAALGAVPRKGIDGAAAALGIARLLTHDHQQAASGDEDEAVAASPWAATDGFQFTGSRLLTLPIAVDGEAKDATVAYGKDGMKVSVDGELPAADAKAFVSNGDVYVVRSGRQTRVRLQDFSAAAAQSTGGDGTVRAPMHGRLLSLFVRAGDAVEPGQRLAVIEAMKMEHTLRAPIAGIVTEVAVGEGAQVVEAAKILVIAPDKAG